MIFILFFNALLSHTLVKLSMMYDALERKHLPTK